MKRSYVLAPLAAFVMLTLMAPSCDSSAPSSTTAKDANQGANQQQIYRTNQPVPLHNYSQLLQTLIDVENAETDGIATTTFFFPPAGSQDPYKVCPSIGYPIHATDSISNPWQLVSNGGSQNYFGTGVIAQQEPNGVFPGQSSGTFVVCVAPSGAKYIDYGEPNVHTTGGPAKWDPKTHMIVITGAPTVVASQKKK